MSRSELEPGEVRLGPTLVCEHGEAQVFERMNARGEREFGFLADGNDPRARAISTGYLELGDSVRPGVRRIKRSIDYTARGPAQVTSSAYRSGWDAVFGSRKAAPCSDESN